MDSAVKDKLKSMFGAQSSRTGGKGTVRRKKKAVRKNNKGEDDKRLQATLKKLNLQTIPGIEEVNMFKTGGMEIVHIPQPKVQASIAANTYVIGGVAEEKTLQEMLPGIASQLGSGAVQQLQKIAQSYSAQAAGPGDNPAEEDDDDVPELVDTNFDAEAEKKDE